MERDTNIYDTKCDTDNFNSHAHVERDILHTMKDLQDANFNSHAHVERDITSPTCKNSRKISTHTLTWSVTEKFIRPYAEFEISTHTLTWSVTGKERSKT